MDPTLPSAPEDQFSRAKSILLDLLHQNGGCIGTRTFRKRLEAKGIIDSGEIIAKLKFYESSEGEQQDMFHHGRSFYTAAAFAELESHKLSASESTSVVIEEEIDSQPEPRPREHRQEEARLVTYVHNCLNDLYATDYGPDECEYTFDVHNDRPGNEFENVDLIAIDWRTDDVVELVAIEVKLDFSAKLVQQANNYRRFADRVWIALPVESSLLDAASVLREIDPLMFEHAVDQGLGILACRRARGRSYEVAPVHWPRKMKVDPVEREYFLDRYRTVFEEGAVLAPSDYQNFPRVR